MLRVLMTKKQFLAMPTSERYKLSVELLTELYGDFAPTKPLKPKSDTNPQPIELNTSKELKHE